MAAMAASAAGSSMKRTKPKPRLRPVSRSLTTICARGQLLSFRAQIFSLEWSYRLIDLAEFLKLDAQSLVVGVPCEAAVVNARQ